jgi:peptide/nickel transport system substrate-binding protein
LAGSQIPTVKAGMAEDTTNAGSGRAIGFLLVVLVLLVVACGSSAGGESGTDAPADADGTPKQGGTLRVGIQGSSSTETNNPIIDNTNLSDGLRRVLLYDAVTKLAPDGSLIGAASGQWEYNDDLTELRFTIKDGAQFHDGDAVTAADVAYSLRLYGEMGFGTGSIPIDWPNVTVDGDQAVAPLLRARTDVPENLAVYQIVVKDGTADFAEAPVGSGPFKLDIFDVGSGVARLVRNDDYPEPVYLDAIEIRAFEDITAMTNAFLAGELDVAMNVGGANARLAEGADDVAIVPKTGALHFPFVMRLDEAPFDNPDVRLALKLAVDRQALVDGVLQGRGAVGNDMLMPADPDYNDTLPQRERDLPRAIELLEDAGYSADDPLQLMLYSNPGRQSMVDAATLFVEQLNSSLPMIQAAVELVPAETYWSEVWLTKPFYTSWMQTFPLMGTMETSLGYSGGEYNETGMNRADFDALVEEAVAAVDPETRREALFAAQEIMWEDGGFIVWGYADEIDLTRPNVRGLPTVPGKARYALWQVWLDN